MCLHRWVKYDEDVKDYLYYVNLSNILCTPSYSKSANKQHMGNVFALDTEMPLRFITFYCFVDELARLILNSEHFIHSTDLRILICF